MDTVKLGNYVFPVVSQKHARLRRLLTQEDFEKIMTKNYASEAYRLLCVLIPAMDPNSKANRESGRGGMPLWEFEGYVSQEAMEADDYDEDNDPCPTTAQIVDAFETVFMVSGAGRLGKIVELVQTVTALQTQTPTAPSPVSPGNTGE